MMIDMTEKRYYHDGVVIIDHLKKDLIYIDGKENLLELAEYVDKLQEENEQLKCRIELLQNEIDMLNGKGVPFKTVEDIEKRQKGDDRND